MKDRLNLNKTQEQLTILQTKFEGTCRDLQTIQVKTGLTNESLNSLQEQINSARKDITLLQIAIGQAQTELGKLIPRVTELILKLEPISKFVYALIGLILTSFFSALAVLVFKQ